jgi:hypothetical protein
VVLGAIVMLSAGLAAVFSLQITSYEPDELGYTHLAMGIAHSLSPITLSYGGGERLNQLYPLLIAPWWGTFGNVTAFRITHVWNALLMASAAVPTYLLAREAIVQRWAAYLSAIVVALAPWLTLATTQLTEVAAYPACVWALLAMQRALAQPSWKRDFLALLAIGVASYGRLQLVVLAPVFVLAMLVHELGYAVAASGRRRNLREALKRIVRRHGLLSTVTGVGLLIGIPLLIGGKLASAAGFYGDTFSGVTLNGETLNLARSYIVFIALGIGALPAVLTLGLALETFVAPSSRRVHAFCSIAAVAVVVLTLQVAEISVRFNGVTMQERYLFYIAPLLAVGMSAGLLTGRHRAKIAFGGAVVLALLLGSTHYESQRTAFWYQVSPGMTSFYDWLHPLFSASNAGPQADPGASRQIVAGLVVLGLGALLATLARRVPPSRLLAGVGVTVVAFCGAETTHALWRVVHGNSSGAGLGSGSLVDASWVDDNIPGSASAEQLVANLGGLDTARQTWEDDTFWNRALQGSYTTGSFSDPYLPTTGLSLDTRSGRLRSASAVGSDGPEVAPRYLVVPSRGFPIEPAGRVVAHSPSGQLQLVRVSRPLRAAWDMAGVSPDGWLRAGRPATLRLYESPAEAGGCVKVGLTLWLSTFDPDASRVSLRGSARSTTVVVLRPGMTRTLYARLCPSPARVATLWLLTQPGANSVTPLTPQLLRVAIEPA